MLVRDLMTEDVVTVDVDATVRDAARLIREHNVGSVIVLEDGRCAGIVTDRQIVVETIAKDADPSQTLVEEIMTEEPVCVGEEDTIFDAACLVAAEGPFRRLPVVDEDGGVVGVLSVADLALAAHPLIEAVLCETEASVREADVEETEIKEEIHGTLPTPAAPGR